MVKRILACMLSVMLVFSLAACNSSDYKNAQNLKEQSEFEKAAELFEKLGDYKDSKTQVQECIKLYIDELCSNGSYETALEFATKFAEKDSEFNKYIYLSKAHIAADKILNNKETEGWKDLKSINLKSVDLDIGSSVYNNILLSNINGSDKKIARKAFNLLMHFSENSHPSYEEAVKGYVTSHQEQNPEYKRFNLQIGDTFKYGIYPYNLKNLSSYIVDEQYPSKDLVYAKSADFADAEVEWLVLDKQGSKLLITTKNIVDSTYCMGKKMYDERNRISRSDYSNTLWKDSYVRQFLNSEFKADLLRKDEDFTVPTTIDDCETKDSVFLLSLAEVEKYKSVKGYPATATPYAVARKSNVGNGYVVPYLDDYNKAMNGTYAFATRRTADDPIPPDDYLVNSRNPVWVWITFANSQNYDPELGDKKYETDFGYDHFSKNMNVGTIETQYLRPAMWVDFTK